MMDLIIEARKVIAEKGIISTHDLTHELACRHNLFGEVKGADVEALEIGTKADVYPRYQTTGRSFSCIETKPLAEIMEE